MYYTRRTTTIQTVLYCYTGLDTVKDVYRTTTIQDVLLQYCYTGLDTMKDVTIHWSCHSTPQDFSDAEWLWQAYRIHCNANLSNIITRGVQLGFIIRRASTLPQGPEGTPPMMEPCPCPRRAQAPGNPLHPRPAQAPKGPVALQPKRGPLAFLDHDVFFVWALGPLTLGKPLGS